MSTRALSYVVIRHLGYYRPRTFTERNLISTSDDRFDHWAWVILIAWLYILTIIVTLERSDLLGSQKIWGMTSIAVYESSTRQEKWLTTLLIRSLHSSGNHPIIVAHLVLHVKNHVLEKFTPRPTQVDLYSRKTYPGLMIDGYTAISKHALVLSSVSSKPYRILQAPE